jgi:hypothetical protein
MLPPISSIATKRQSCCCLFGRVQDLKAEYEACKKQGGVDETELYERLKQK